MVHHNAPDDLRAQGIELHPALAMDELDKTPVLFMAGGTASGKSTIAGPVARAGLIVFDSTFSNLELSKLRLQEAERPRKYEAHRRL
jgi:hypothetical protein